jgi:hypothetical protein
MLCYTLLVIGPYALKLTRVMIGYNHITIFLFEKTRLNCKIKFLQLGSPFQIIEIKFLNRPWDIM